MSRLDKLQKLAAAQPNDPFVHYGVGLELAAQERWEDAIAAYERSLALDAKYTAAHLQKAHAEIRLKRRDAARMTLSEGLTAANLSGDRHTADEMSKLLETLG